MEETIIYQLTVEDIQTVAEDILERQLTKKEILSILDKIEDNINWFEAIEKAIESELM